LVDWLIGDWLIGDWLIGFKKHPESDERKRGVSMNSIKFLPPEV